MIIYPSRLPHTISSVYRVGANAKGIFICNVEGIKFRGASSNPRKKCSLISLFLFVRQFEPIEYLVLANLAVSVQQPQYLIMQLGA